MINLTKLRAELAEIRSLRDRINAAVGRGRPTRGQWETLLALATREKELVGGTEAGVLRGVGTAPYAPPAVE